LLLEGVFSDVPLQPYAKSTGPIEQIVLCRVSRVYSLAYIRH
jgi:hypothetical protein